MDKTIQFRITAYSVDEIVCFSETSMRNIRLGYKMYEQDIKRAFKQTCDSIVVNFDYDSAGHKGYSIEVSVKAICIKHFSGKTEVQIKEKVKEHVEHLKQTFAVYFPKINISVGTYIKKDDKYIYYH